MSKQVDWDLLPHIKLIKTSYTPQGKAVLIGRHDGSIHAFGTRLPGLDLGKQVVGMIDLNTDEMLLAEKADIQELWADEPTLDRIKAAIDRGKKE